MSLTKPGRPSARLGRPALLLARIVVAALIATIAAIHLDLWSSHGYRHIPTIGVLFLLNAAAGGLLALASLFLPSRLAPFAWLGGAGFAAGTLAALLISLNGHLFGFHETTGAPLLAASIAVEAATLLLGLSAALVARRLLRPLPLGGTPYRVR